MKEIKWLLYKALTALYVSAWWAAAVWGGVFWFTVSIWTAVLGIYAITYIADNWDES